MTDSLLLNIVLIVILIPIVVQAAIIILGILVVLTGSLILKFNGKDDE